MHDQDLIAFILPAHMIYPFTNDPSCTQLPSVRDCTHKRGLSWFERSRTAIDRGSSTSDLLTFQLHAVPYPESQPVQYAGLCSA
ncbi:hypothetical protein FIBSPDRAFT_852562 [Athelia psychrophila]|uniref:Uncharacterized protein n=1 Tax=Athelia psychrophila TaxID=1759441 RepID=A0A166RLX4_9AGAM|nr:hypothetical protein FIBSPDRAFT_852562 [Fibularhizoctonia sp. CBS 109695]